VTSSDDPVVLHEDAPAKINLFLHIEGRRDDGLHDLASLVVFTEFGDAVRISPGRDLTLKRSGPFADLLPADPREDLCLRAAMQLADTFGQQPKVAISLEKNIPVAAGIGGGSSDAAAVLRGLCGLWGLDRDDPRVLEIAAELGADVPVCLFGRPSLIKGVGDVITPLEQAPELHILLVNPGQGLSTAAVFGALEWGSDRNEEPVAMAGSQNRAALMQMLQTCRNDLTSPALGICPLIATVLDRLAQAQGCELARMSGSGATCFAVFPDAHSCRSAVGQIAREHPEWWVQATRTRSQF
jgi:4-diphosphocytidyl-2-C-methyl-D-erythritol kinase